MENLYSGHGGLFFTERIWGNHKICKYESVFVFVFCCHRFLDAVDGGTGAGGGCETFRLGVFVF